MIVNLRIHGFVTSQPGIYGNATKAEYECLVSFANHHDHLSVMKEFLNDCGGSPIDSDPSYRQLLNEWNCARALVWDYFREKRQPFADNSYDLVSASKL